MKKLIDCNFYSMIFDIMYVDIVDNLLSGNKRAISHAISILDDKDSQSNDILKKYSKIVMP